MMTPLILYIVRKMRDKLSSIEKRLLNKVRARTSTDPFIIQLRKDAKKTQILIEEANKRGYFEGVHVRYQGEVLRIDQFGMVWSSKHKTFVTGCYHAKTHVYYPIVPLYSEESGEWLDIVEDDLWD